MLQSNKHLLVLAYEYPPAAGPGVQRVTALTKYLVRQGWRVSVVCAEPVSSAPRDESMLPDAQGVNVIALPARHVATAVARLLAPFKRSSRPSPAPSSAPVAPGAAGTSAASAADSRSRRPLSGRISRWIAVPDDAVFWRESAVRAAVAVHASDPVDAILASGPPYSAMLAGCEVGARVRVPVVLDLRDPWRDNAGLHWPTPWHRRRSDALERRALACASATVAVSEPIAEEARSMGAQSVSVLPNGYDPERVPAWAPDAAAPLRLVFLGRFSTTLMDPAPLFAGMALAAERSEVARSARLTVLGPDYEWVRALAQSAGVAQRVEMLGYRPNAEALARVAAADAGVIVLADLPGTEAVYSSKLFDYLGVGIPILLAGPSGCAAARVVREARAGVVADPEPRAIADAIVALAEAKAAGRAPQPRDEDVVARFDRSKQAAELSALLERVVEVTR